MTWSRPTELGYDADWCLVTEVVGGSVVTACRGRFKLTDPHESRERPPMHERCGACQQARVELGLRELRDSQPQVRHQPSSDDWDLFDLGGEA